MIKFGHIEVFNLEGAFRGLRNPLESWNKSDSEYCLNRDGFDCNKCPLAEHGCNEAFGNYAAYIIGPNDLKLAQRMLSGSNAESKFMRQIFVSMDIIAPIYVWKQIDTYKVGTTTNSCSTMHMLSKTPITLDMFSHDGIDGEGLAVFKSYIFDLERLRQAYNSTQNKKYWDMLIKMLPESWNQKRTWTGNYQVLRTQYFDRRFHKLVEWHDYCKMIETLPYGKELICYE